MADDEYQAVPLVLTVGNGKQRRHEVAEENVVPACCRVQEGYEGHSQDKEAQVPSRANPPAAACLLNQALEALLLFQALEALLLIQAIEALLS